MANNVNPSSLKMTTTKRRRGRPAKDEATPSREELLRVVFEQFAEHGYENMSLRKLGAKLGVSDSLFTHHFGSKEKLWFEAMDLVLRPVADRLLAVLDQGTETKDPPARLRANMVLGMQMAAFQPALLRLAFNEASSPSQRGVYLRTHFVEPYLAHIDRAIAECQRLGYLRDFQLNSMHAMFMGAFRTLVEPGLLQGRVGNLRSNPSELQAYIDSVMEILFVGMRQMPSSEQANAPSKLV